MAREACREFFNVLERLWCDVTKLQRAVIVTTLHDGRRGGEG